MEEKAKSKSKSSITCKRIRLLNKINFPWMTRSEETWDKHLDELREFQRHHGHVLVPRTYPPNPPLSAWVATQWKYYNQQQRRRRGVLAAGEKGKPSPLTMDRIQELNKLGFVWSFWDYNFYCLAASSSSSSGNRAGTEYSNGRGSFP